MNQGTMWTMMTEPEQKFPEKKRGCHNNSVLHISDKKESLATHTPIGFYRGITKTSRSLADMQGQQRRSGRRTFSHTLQTAQDL
jgi:hypothetical protein